MVQICCGISFFLTLFPTTQSSRRPWVRNVGSAGVTVVGDGKVWCAKVRALPTVAISATPFNAEALRQHAKATGSGEGFGV